MPYPQKRNGKLTGRWVAEVQIGGRRQKKVCPSEGAARQAEATFKEEGPPQSLKGPTPVMTYARAVERYGPELWKGRPVEQNALRGLRGAKRWLGDTPLVNLKTKDLHRVVLGLRNAGRKNETIKKHLSYIRKLLVKCLDEELIPQVPRVPWPNVRPNDTRRPLEDHEEPVLLGLLPEHVREYCIVALDTGMRRGEMMSLKPDNLTPDGRMVHLERTKTDYSRTIPLTSRARDILTRRAATHSRGERLFGDITKDTLRYHWDKAKEAMGLEDDEGFTPHCLRHAAATRLARRDVSPWKIQRFMGHRSLSTTMIYVHMVGKDIADLADVLSMEA